MLFPFDVDAHVPSIDMVLASDMFHGGDGDGKIKEIRAWLNAQGVRDFEPVSLYCDQLKTVSPQRTCSRLRFLIYTACVGDGD